MKTREHHDKYQVWIDARKRHKLSHATVHMARQLGMTPEGVDKLARASQHPGKPMLADVIAKRYLEKFGRPGPPQVLSIEQMAEREGQKRAEQRARKAERRAEQTAHDVQEGADLSPTEDHENTEGSPG